MSDWTGDQPSPVGRVQQIHDTPPHSVEGEQGVLGSMLCSPKLTIPECVAKVSPEWFYVPAHKTIYSVMVDLWIKGKAIDLITFTQDMRDANLLESVGGASYVTNLFTFVPTAANVEYYIEIIRDKFILREIIAASTESVRRAHEEQDEVMALLDETRDRIANIMVVRPGQRKTIKELVEDKVARMERGDQASDVLRTGLNKLDYYSQLHQGDMPVVSGETKAGKSIFALSIAKNVAASGTHIAIFNLESTNPEVTDRLLAGISRVNMDRQQYVTGLSDDELHRSVRGASALSELPIHLYDDVFDLHHIIAESRRIKLHYKVGLIIVDYAQLVRTKVEKNRNREQEVASISRAIRLLALDLKTPIILLSQLNEEGKSRESRAIEQDCTALWNIARPKETEDQNMRHIQIRIQRNGPSNIAFPVTFLGPIARVENYADEITP